MSSPLSWSTQPKCNLLNCIEATWSYLALPMWYRCPDFWQVRQAGLCPLDLSSGDRQVWPERSCWGFCWEALWGWSWGFCFWSCEGLVKLGILFYISVVYHKGYSWQPHKGWRQKWLLIVQGGPLEKEGDPTDHPFKHPRLAEVILHQAYHHVSLIVYWWTTVQFSGDFC